VLAGDFTVIAGVESARKLVVEIACANGVEAPKKMQTSANKPAGPTIRLNENRETIWLTKPWKKSGGVNAIVAFTPQLFIDKSP
jgi:hypothetical protein